MPAHWSPETLATIVIIGSGPVDPRSMIPTKATLLSRQDLADGAHVVAAIGTARLRLLVEEASGSSGPALHIPLGKKAAARTGASQNFLAALDGRPVRITGPTAYQRRRLTLALRIADARADQASTRLIAETLTFPRSRLAGGAAWKGSDERRQTLRQIAFATRMVRGGFRSLPGFAG